MADWRSLTLYVRANYKVAEETDRMMKLLFGVGGGRSQMVFLWHQTLIGGAEDWVQIESPIGKIEEVSLVPLMREVAETVCGGIGATGDFVTFRHSVPLMNLDMNEFERPLQLVVTTADRLEHRLVGGDRF